MKSALILSVGVLLAIVCTTAFGEQRQGCTCGDLGTGFYPCSCDVAVVKANTPVKPYVYASPQAINQAAALRAAAQKAAAQRAAMIAAGSSRPQLQGAYTNGMGSAGSSSIGGAGSSSIGSGSFGTAGSSISASGGFRFSGSKQIHSPYGNFGRGGLQSGTDNVAVSDNEYKIPGLTVISGSSSECGCSDSLKKQSLEVKDLLNIGPNAKIAPQFQPIGDLCYPAEVNPKTGALIRTLTKVTPAVPGKITCSSCEIPHPRMTCEEVLSAATNSLNANSGNVELIGDHGAFSGSNINIVDQVRELIRGSTGVSGSSIVTGVGGVADSNQVSGLGKFGGSSVSGGLGGFSGGNVVTRVVEPGSAGSSVSSSQGSSGCFDDDVPAVQAVPQAPADAVSLTLAYKNIVSPRVVVQKSGKKIVPEDRLSYGHRTLPANEPSSKKSADIPEEKLLAVDKPVYELKPVATPNTIVVGGYDEAEEEEDFAELEALEREKQAVEQAAAPASYITYKDLGYAPVKPSTVARQTIRTSVVSSNSASSSSQASRITQGSSCSSISGGPCGPLGPPRPDYVPGGVYIEHQTVDVERPKAMRYRETGDDDDEEENCD